MSKSIFDTRFTSKKMALDAACKDALIALDEWITIRGAHVEIDGDGNVVRGAGGKFNGTNYKEAAKRKEQRDPHSLITKPAGVVRDSKLDSHGKPNPEAKVPETLDGATQYFKDMRNACIDARHEAYEKDDMERYRQLDKDVKAYEELRANASDLINKMHEEGSLPEMMARENATEQAKIADSYINSFAEYSNVDTRGVAKWAVMNAYDEVKDYLTPERKKYYSDKINGWKKNK